LIRFEACIRVSQSLAAAAWQGRSRQALTQLEETGALPFVGMDCVEAAPAYGHHELTSPAAAQRVRTWLAGAVASWRRPIHFSRRKRPPPLQVFRGKDCCESRDRMPCWCQPT
jgi:hypothetical protein